MGVTGTHNLAASSGLAQGNRAMAKKGVQELDYKRQEETIRRLPKGFKYPLFSGWQAIQSQRKSGYKTTARTAREIVDNSIEAGADNVYVVFDVLPDKDRKPYQRKNTVTSIAFIDGGPGMIHHSNERSMLRYALSWGGGTHFDDPQCFRAFAAGERAARALCCLRGRSDCE